MKIKKLWAWEILDSQGLPTVACSVQLSDATFVAASVPAGSSKGLFEAYDMRDGEIARFHGMGVRKAIKVINEIIAPHVQGCYPHQETIDRLLIDIDGTENKAYLGANAMLAVSIAVARACAATKKMLLHHYLRFHYACPVGIPPTPIFNVINGGVHADNRLAFQEFLVIIDPKEKAYIDILEKAWAVFCRLGLILKDRGYIIYQGKEGGYAPRFASAGGDCFREALACIREAIDQCNMNSGEIVLGLDIAANIFFSAETERYSLENADYSSQALLMLYENLLQEYGLFYLEDPFAIDDIESWSALMRKLRDRLLIVGDDLLATDHARISHAYEHGLCNAVIIKPNQVGTVSEVIESIINAQRLGLKVIVSHRSGETSDTFIASLAYAFSVDYIKAGPPLHSERLSKYNQILACIASDASL